ncbi:MAG TPA: hypothetical protein VFB66_00695 [Tepidisphaeraceae bacterium]|nr:hypothetical protein [Tepidisphaeraceae bacterium]
MRNLRNLLILAVMAALCFGGTFTCNCDGDDEDEIHGSVTTFE